MEKCLLDISAVDFHFPIYSSHSKTSSYILGKLYCQIAEGEIIVIRLESQTREILSNVGHTDTCSRIYDTFYTEFHNGCVSDIVFKELDLRMEEPVMDALLKIRRTQR